MRICVPVISKPGAALKQRLEPHEVFQRGFGVLSDILDLPINMLREDACNFVVCFPHHLKKCFEYEVL